MDVAIELIGQLGFPIAVALFALWNSYRHELFLQETLEATIKENTTALLELKDMIHQLVREEARTDDDLR